MRALTHEMLSTYIWYQVQSAVYDYNLRHVLLRYSFLGHYACHCSWHGTSPPRPLAADKRRGLLWGYHLGSLVGREAQVHQLDILARVLVK